MTEEIETEETLTPGLVLENHIFEQLADGHYVIFDKTTKSLLALRPSSFPLGTTEYIPLQRLPWPSVTEPKEYESEEQLFNEIKAFLIEHLDIQNELFFDVYACFVLASWRTEDFSVIPYQFFIGPLASGKTRALECFRALCFRSIMASSMSAASLFSVLQAWAPTLLLDESEVYNRDVMVEVLALLNSGYRKGQFALRIEKVEQGCPQIAFFDTFGFKILAGTQELADTLQSRCIITAMSKAVRHINLFVDEAQAQILRNKLLMYRFKNLGNKLETFDVSQLNGYLINNSRVIELFVSLLHVAPTEEIRNRLISCMKAITQSRLDEEQASVEARIFDALIKSEAKVESGKLSTATITESFNEGLIEKDQATSQFIGRRVKALGFEKCRLSGGPQGFFWDQKLIDRLRARYYPSSKTPSLSSFPSLSSLSPCETPTESPSASEVSEVSSPEQPDRLVQNTAKSEQSEGCEQCEGCLEGLPSLQELIEKLAPNMTGTFPEERLLKNIMELGFSQEERQKRIDHFKVKELVGHDDVGNWYFVR